ncbi:MAG: substrate-binding domain-containing protein [Opitutaceae bacterium]|nr:substrate-binding domain-containing protein [Opitutaceae bacterium]
MLLAEAARQSGLRCPEKVGVLTVMGTDLATRAKLTCLRYDFRKMGHRAVAVLGAENPIHESLPPQLVPGETT